MKTPRKVYRWSMDGRLLDTYTSPKEAAEKLGASYSRIQKWSKGNRILNGCIISRVSDPMSIAIIASNKIDHKVEMYEMVPVLVATFGSISEAAEMSGYSPKRISDAVNQGHLVNGRYKFKKT